MVVLMAIYAGGSVPDEFRRYIVTDQDTTSANLQAAVDTHTGDDWQSVGHYVVGKDMLAAMSGPERAAIRAAYQQEISAANSEAQIRQRIRVPLLPGPVMMADAGPSARAIVPVVSDAPVHTAAAPIANKPEPVAAATPMDEDLATIEALKTALQDLRKEGVTIGGYRNDIADK